MNQNALASEATRILRENDRGGYTIPSARLYPHQWNWDSAFCAIGWAHVDAARAISELERLARGQWARGLIPHILFNPEASHYEPGPAVWQTAGAAGAPASVATSSITQPPVAAIALRILLEHASDTPAVAASAPALVGAFDRWHDWFAVERRVRQEGCIAIVHPWESGMDNSPRWDEALARVVPIARTYRRVDNTVVDATQRPTHEQYDRYFALVAHWKAVDFGPPDPKRDPFVVEDVAMTAILCAAEDDLAFAAEKLGNAEVAERARARRSAWQSALEARFDPAARRFWDFDLVAGRAVLQDTIASLLPLLAQSASQEVAAALADELTQGAYAAPWPVPSTPPGARAFEPRRYWRGPSWPNTNWLLIRAFDRYGLRETADWLAERTLALVAERGFFEYFDATTGEGLGGERFSWTAAVVLDLLARRPAN